MSVHVVLAHETNLAPQDINVGASRKQSCFLVKIVERCARILAP